MHHIFHIQACMERKTTQLLEVILGSIYFKNIVLQNKSSYRPRFVETSYEIKVVLYTTVELAWRNGSVMDCQATVRSSIPSGNSVKTELHVLRKGQ